MDMLENKDTRKRRMPKAGKLALAAALAAGCVLSIAAGLPARVYNFATGGTFTSIPGSDQTIMTVGGEAAPVEAEDGRLWFEADGQRVDITDQVDENTPYVYERTDPATGEKGYVIVGGTVEDFGWAEFHLTEDGIGSIVGVRYTSSLVTLPDGSQVSFFDLTEEQRQQLADENGFIVMGYDNRPWMDAALAQLGLLEGAED